MSFERLAADVDRSLAIGPAAGSLVRGLLQLVFSGPKGLGGFLDLLGAAGLGGLPSSWIGKEDNPPLSPQGVTQGLGAATVAELAQKAGLDPGVATAALALLLPRLIGFLTKGGGAPASPPPAVAAFLAAGGSVAAASVAAAPAAAAPSAPAAAAPTAAARPVAGEAGRGMFRNVRGAETIAPPKLRGEDTAGVNRYIFPGVAALLAAAFIYHFFTSRPEQASTAPASAPTAAPAPAPAAPAPAAASAAALAAPHFFFANSEGAVSVSGVVGDEATRGGVMDALNKAFGDKVSAAISLASNVAAAPWLDKLSDALDALKAPGVKAAFDGTKIAVGGALPQVDVDAILSRLSATFGAGFSFAHLDAVDFSSLKENFTGSDLAGVLNRIVLNFETGSAAIDDAGKATLKQAAVLIAKLPAGAVVQIAGYTDRAGDPSANLALSQKRAEAVRDALIEAGVSPAALTAVGHGSEAPTVEGASRTDRRIEFSVTN